MSCFFFSFRAAKRSILTTIKTISNYFHQLLSLIKVFRRHVEIFCNFHSVKFFDWLDSKGDENITIVLTVPFICYDRRLCKTTLHYIADKVTPIQLISNRKIYILRHEFQFFWADK